MGDSFADQHIRKVIQPIIAADAKDKVVFAQRRWNEAVREAIRNETGLRLSNGQRQQSIPVTVADAVPPQFAQLLIKYNDPVLWRLILGQPRLQNLLDGVAFLLREWVELEKWPLLPPVAKGASPALWQTKEIANALLLLAQTKEVRQRITELDRDFLGLYHTRTPSVELYWAPIAIMAAQLDVPIEDLTVVVLIHELAHGYTHIGFDIDGQQWNGGAFSDSDAAVTEGLAQSYTDAVTSRLGSKGKNVREAYERLLKWQTGPYVVHQDWLKDESRRGEAVRFALVAARSDQPITHERWLEMLSDNKKRLPPEEEQLVTCPLLQL